MLLVSIDDYGNCRIVERVCSAWTIPFLLERQEDDDRSFRHEPEWLMVIRCISNIFR